MNRYDKFKGKLNELKIPYCNKSQILEESLIEEYTNLVMNNKSLPNHITYEKISVVDYGRRNEIYELYKNHKEIPSDIEIVEGKNNDGLTTISIFYNNKFQFYSTEYYSNEDLEFSLKLKQTKDNQTIANALQYFKVLSIVTLIICFILMIIVLSDAY